jgi:hypothetical protein
MPEITYYSDSAVQVSNEWVKLGGKIYSVSEIDSVKMRSAQSDPTRELPYFLMIAGSITTFVLLNLQQMFPKDWESLVPRVLIFGLLVGIAGLGLLLLQTFLKSDYLYAIKLSGTFGDALPFASDDQRYVQKIINAIKLAIDDQPQEMPASARITVDA